MTEFRVSHSQIRTLLGEIITGPSAADIIQDYLEDHPRDFGDRKTLLTLVGENPSSAETINGYFRDRALTLVRGLFGTEDSSIGDITTAFNSGGLDPSNIGGIADLVAKRAHDRMEQGIEQAPHLASAAALLLGVWDLHRNAITGLA